MSENNSIEAPKQLWRFTFGCGQEHAGYCQPIYGTFNSTRKKMFDMYGSKWSFQYSEEQWEKAVERARDNIMFEVEIELERVDAEEEVDE